MGRLFASALYGHLRMQWIRLSCRAPYLWPQPSQVPKRHPSILGHSFWPRTTQNLEGCTAENRPTKLEEAFYCEHTYGRTVADKRSFPGPSYAAAGSVYLLSDPGGSCSEACAASNFACDAAVLGNLDGVQAFTDIMQTFLPGKTNTQLAACCVLKGSVL